jgi:hypothetical protein
VLPLKYPQLFTGLLAPWRGECLTAVLHQECLPDLVPIRQPAPQYGGSTYSSGSMQLACVMLPGWPIFVSFLPCAALAAGLLLYGPPGTCK